MKNPLNSESECFSFDAFTRRVLTAVGITLLLILFILFIWQSIQVLLLIFASFLFSIFLRWLKYIIRKTTRLPQGLSLSLAIIVLILSLTLLSLFLAPVVKEQTLNLAEDIPRYTIKLKFYLLQFSWGDEVIEQAQEPEQLINNQDGEETSFLDQIIGLFSITFGVLTGLLFIVVMGIYIAANPLIYVNGILRLIPRHRRPRALHVMHSLSTTIRGWLLGQSFSMAVLGTIVGLGLWLLGVPNAVVLGLFAAIMTFIPNLGPVFAFIPAILVALPLGLMKALYVTIFYIIVQNIEGNFLTPMVQQKVIAVPPVLILSTQLLLYNLIGFLGILLAMPLLACIMVIVRMVYVEDVLGDRMSDPIQIDTLEPPKPTEN